MPQTIAIYIELWSLLKVLLIIRLTLLLFRYKHTDVSVDNLVVKIDIDIKYS